MLFRQRKETFDEVLDLPDEFHLAAAEGTRDVNVLGHIDENDHGYHVGAGSEAVLDRIADRFAGAPGLVDGVLHWNSAGAVHSRPVFAVDGADCRHEDHGEAAVLLEENHCLGDCISVVDPWLPEYLAGSVGRFEELVDLVHGVVAVENRIFG